jgi:hypothetical protein
MSNYKETNDLVANTKSQVAGQAGVAPHNTFIFTLQVTPNN